MMSIGQRIKECRELLKMTQESLANKIGTTKQTIYKYENDIITNIPPDKVELLAKALAISPAYLMGWIDNDAEKGGGMKEEKKLVSAVRPRGTDEACVIQVIRTKSLVGAGTPDDLSKIMVQYWDFEGNLLATSYYQQAFSKQADA